MSVKKSIWVIQNLEKNKKSGKYIAEKSLLGVSRIVTTDDIGLALMFKSFDAADSYSKGLDCRTKVVEKNYILDEKTQKRLADNAIKKISDAYSADILFDPETVVTMDALVKQYKGLSPLSILGKDFSCPACGVYVPFDKSKQSVKEAPCFCKTCGQRFDWKDILDSE